MIFVLLLIILAAVFLGSFIFNIVKLKGGLRIGVIAFNALIVAVFLVTLFLNVMPNGVDKDKYTEYGGGLFNSYNYAGEAEGYVLITNHTFISSDSFAVPEGNIKVPAISKFYTDLKVYTDGDMEESEEEIQIGAYFYDIRDNVVAIAPDYTNLCIETGILGIMILLIGNVLCTIVILVTYIIKKRKEA